MGRRKAKIAKKKHGLYQNTAPVRGIRNQNYMRIATGSMMRNSSVATCKINHTALDAPPATRN